MLEGEGVASESAGFAGVVVFVFQFSLVAEEKTYVTLRSEGRSLISI